MLNYHIPEIAKKSDGTPYGNMIIDYKYEITNYGRIHLTITDKKDQTIIRTQKLPEETIDYLFERCQVTNQWSSMLFSIALDVIFGGELKIIDEVMKAIIAKKNKEIKALKKTVIKMI